MVERCPDKTEVVGPIPTTRTNENPGRSRGVLVRKRQPYSLGGTEIEGGEPCQSHMMWA